MGFGRSVESFVRISIKVMQVADLKFVTWKIAFLVLLATGSRRGEVHAFDYAKVRPSKKWTDIPEPHAKTELSKTGASVLAPVRMPALGPILGPGEG